MTPRSSGTDASSVAIPANTGDSALPTPGSETVNDLTLGDLASQQRPDLGAKPDLDRTSGVPPEGDPNQTMAIERQVPGASHRDAEADSGQTLAFERCPTRADRHDDNAELRESPASEEGRGQPGLDSSVESIASVMPTLRDEAALCVASPSQPSDGDTLAMANYGRTPAPAPAIPSSMTDLDSSSPPILLGGVGVPGYDLLQELGRGGMGVVYKARHRRLHRLVALKMILGGAHVGQVGLARFRTEAEAVAKLHHANIVQIYETGEHDGCPYLSLEFVEGGSLEQQMRESPTTPFATAELVETLARAMEFAHQHGIVHRDLKPANILLAKHSGHTTQMRRKETVSSSLSSDHWSRTTIPKIADFGLAKRVDDDSGNTQSGTILGTPCYMAPEQAEGHNSQVGPPADIYALGSILYELLIGRPPFKANNPLDTIRQVIGQDPVPPRQLEPRVPLDLETICLKCLEKDPARRFATAADLADDLRRFLDGHPIQSRPIRPWERAWKWARRRPAIMALVGVCALAVVGMVLFIAWHNVSLRGQLDAAIAEERLSRRREQAALVERHLSLLQQEGQKLFDGARVAVAAGDWSQARLQLEKALTTIGDEAPLESLKASARTLLGQVETELRAEANRKGAQARFQQFVKLRNEAQFLGTLYTGMDLALNLQAARASVQQALAIYGVLREPNARPAIDADLKDAQKAEVLGDCYELLLVLAETEAQSASDQKPAEKETYLRRALGYLDHAGTFGTPSRAFHLRRARYLRMLGKPADAEQAEQAAGKASLDNILDHFLLADEFYRREQFREAIQEFDRVLERNPSHFWAQYLNALCLLRQQRPAEARALLGACLAQRTDFVWLYLLRGFAQEELQAWDAADSDFQKAAQLPLDENTRYVLLVYRAVLRIRTDRYADAVADLQEAIRLKPNAYQAFVNLANAYRKLGNLEQAVAQLNHALELEPGLAHLYRLRARLQLERNQPASALADFDQAIARETASGPYQVDDLLDRGRLLLRDKKYPEAIASFNAALALRSDHPQALRLQAEALFHLGRFEEVVAAFDRYLETGKPLESVYRGRGLARAELGRYPGAIEDFTKALELAPTSAVQAYRGWMHLGVDAPKLALRDFELAIELDPRNGDAYTGRGVVLAGQGRYADAARDAAEAIRLGPPSPRLYYNAARIYAQCPDPSPQRAVDLLQQALHRLPGDQQRAFWSKNIRKDPALATLRRRPAFIQMETTVLRRN
jgi:eukaryotic-like serine/threonine-protein kinase